MRKNFTSRITMDKTLLLGKLTIAFASFLCGLWITGQGGQIHTIAASLSHHTLFYETYFAPLELNIGSITQQCLNHERLACLYCDVQCSVLVLQQINNSL